MIKKWVKSINCSYLPITIFCLTMLFIIPLMTGCSSYKSEKPTNENPPEYRLQLSVSPSDNPTYSYVYPEELGGKYENQILYHRISDVFIQIDGADVNTVEEIIAYAKIDARNGMCEMQYQSDLGYAHYSYIYEGYELVTSYDVFEAPDGTSYHCESLTIGLSGYTEGTGFRYPMIRNRDVWIDIGREDWGLSFEPVKANTSGITIKCVQSGGQQFGELQIYGYELWSLSGDVWERCLRKKNPEFAFGVSEAISPNDTSEIVIDWTDNYGYLPAGRYQISVYVQDIYNEQELHEFIKDYQDSQIYYFEFEIED